MKTTVSAAFFILLTAYECSAQYYQFYRPSPFFPILSVNGQSNNPGPGHQQSPHYSQQSSQHQNVNSQTNQNQAGQSSTVGAWMTPDSRIEQSWTPSTSTRRSTRRSTKPTPTSGQEAVAWPRPIVEPAGEGSHGKSTTTPRPRTRVPSAPRLKMTTAKAPAQGSDDRFQYPPPGANAQDTTHNSLETMIPDEPDSASYINNGLRQFALDMLMDMTQASPDKNVVISPYSIWAVMIVIFEGAEGQTANQIAKTLMLRGGKARVRNNYKRLEYALQKANNESHSDFVSGNGIFYDQNRPLMNDFESFALSSYQCHLQPLDFKNPMNAVKTINEWVSEVTRKKIKMLVKPDDIKRPELIITNALFFKGSWKIPFNLSATHQEKFYDEQKRHVADVRMMYQKGAYMYSFIAEIGAHVLDMPYEDDKFRMLVVLPKPTSTVSEVLRLMKLFPVDQCYERLVREQEMFSEDEVHVYLPRFKFSNRVELRPNLERLGITDVFTDQANLYAMSSVALALGKVFHVSEIDVNEEGTVASAATAGGFVNKMAPPKFLANRPFAYFIVENSLKTVIFAGKVADPTKKSN